MMTCADCARWQDEIERGMICTYCGGELRPRRDGPGLLPRRLPERKPEGACEDLPHPCSEACVCTTLDWLEGRKYPAFENHEELPKVRGTPVPEDCWCGRRGCPGGGSCGYGAAG